MTSVPPAKRSAGDVVSRKMMTQPSNSKRVTGINYYQFLEVIKKVSTTMPVLVHGQTFIVLLLQESFRTEKGHLARRASPSVVFFLSETKTAFIVPSDASCHKKSRTTRMPTTQRSHDEHIQYYHH